MKKKKIEKFYSSTVSKYQLCHLGQSAEAIYMLNILQAIKSAPDELNSLDFIWYFYCFICKLHCIVFVFIPELVIWNDAGEFLELYVFDQVIIFSPKEKVLRGHKIKRQSKNSLTLTHGGWLVIQVENHFHVKGNWQRRYISRNNIRLNDMLIVARGVILTQEKVFFLYERMLEGLLLEERKGRGGNFYTPANFRCCCRLHFQTIFKQRWLVDRGEGRR